MSCEETGSNGNNEKIVENIKIEKIRMHLDLCVLEDHSFKPWEARKWNLLGILAEEVAWENVSFVWQKRQRKTKIYVESLSSGATKLEQP